MVLINFLTVIIGVLVVLLLANIIIKNSIQLAEHFGLSGSFIGLTVLSIGTSIPEIMTHIIGSINIVKNPELINTLSGLLIGTNIGSDIFQQNFVLAVIALVGTVVVYKKNLITEMGGLIAASLLVWVFSLGGIISRIEGGFLLFAYVGYLIYLKKNNGNEKIKAENNLKKSQVALAFSLLIISFIIMGFVANLVLDASTILVSFLPLSASFFGIILLGISTALPELTTSLVAVLKKKQDISAGILIGSNITNPLFGIGIGALISTYTIPNVIVLYDLPVKIGTAFVIYFFLWRKENLSKKEAVVLIALFLAYVAIRQIYFPVDF
jgi:cation:H+ antiporter